MERADQIQKMAENGFLIICSYCGLGATRIKKDMFMCSNPSCNNENITSPDSYSVKQKGFQFRKVNPSTQERIPDSELKTFEQVKKENVKIG